MDTGKQKTENRKQKTGDSIASGKAGLNNL